MLRLQIEFLTAGAGYIGSQLGGWVGMFSVLDFVPPPWRRYPPGVTLTPSTIGGVQYESHFMIQLWQGAWWVAHNGNWLGRFPIERFGADPLNNPSNLMATKACEALWYGEVYDSKSTPTTWTWTDMGSGQFPSAGFRNAANFRNPGFWDLSGLWWWPDNAVSVTPNNPACYRLDPLSAGQAPWDRWFYLGGPGGDAPNLDCPVKLLP